MTDKRRFSDMDGRSNSSGGMSQEQPPHSRLFVICNKAITEDTIRQEFGTYGVIDEVWMIKDRVTGDHKGIAYVKFALTSAAAKALEEMHGKQIGGINRPIKVLIAHSKGEGSKKEPMEEERVLRLFVVCKKDATENDLFDHFKQFGQIDHVKLVRNRNSNENKGFAYIKFFKMSHAALAYEGCDRSFKAKFAEPRPLTRSHASSVNDPYDANPYSSANQYKMPVKPQMQSGYGGEAPFTKLQIMLSPVVTQEQLWRLCDIAPGLEFCRIFPDYRAKNPNDRLMATVQYSSPGQAAHARDKLNGLEYPPGMFLTVRPDRADSAAPPMPSIPPFPMPSCNSPLSKSDIEMLAENVKQATALLKASAGMKSLSEYCTAKLPEPRNFEEDEPSSDGPECRVFVVFNPAIPERQAIKDVFGRFGRVLDIFLLSGKNVGYVTYAKKEAVLDAISALHGRELCGQFMKVMEAEPRRGGGSGGPDEDRRKRIRVGEDDFIPI